MQSETNVQGTHPEWPTEGLERVLDCPVCGGDTRELVHDALTDRVYFCAPGEWNMYRCGACASTYLDPRPTRETIGLAYQRYATHEKTEVRDFQTLSVLKRLRRSLANGYRNHRYGTRLYPASILGILAAIVMPDRRAIIDWQMRHLPKGNSRKWLLDLGCGNGEFLLRARSAGWEVVGADPDAKAVEAARGHGLEVRLGGVEALDPSVERFDVITLAHVIEHVHHPGEVLEACYRLLKPGGYLWLETPNITSEGHEVFGRNWRGLEPPRHLVLFTAESLRQALSRAGFIEVKVQSYFPLWEDIFGASQAIAEGIDPYSVSRPKAPRGLVRKAERIARRDPARREFITVKAWKA